MTLAARNIRATIHALNGVTRLAKLIEPKLFRRVRLGTALWHTLVVARQPLTAKQIADLLERGALDTSDLTKSVKNGLKYHAKVGRLRYAGHDRWEAA